MPRKTTETSVRSKLQSTAKKQRATKRTDRGAVAGDAANKAFAEALSVDFKQHGASAIARVRQDDPVTYMKLCASVLPKSVISSINPLDTLTDEELQKRAQHLAEKVGIGTHPDPNRNGETGEPESPSHV